MKEKIKEILKEAWTRFKKNGTDAAVKIDDFRTDHPFLYGFILGQVVWYWSLVLYGLFHPHKKLDWVDKK